jgi:hypothetical protein
MNHRRDFMKRSILSLLAPLFAWFALAASPAAAQNIYPFQTPQFRYGYQTPLSPYLNMLIPGNAAVNYYALVEPQFQRRQQFNLLNNQIQSLAINQIPPPPGAVDVDLTAPMPATGHPVAFSYTGSLFNNVMVGPSSAGVLPSGVRPGAGQQAGYRPAQAPGMGGGGAGVWPNMRPQYGAPGR